MPDFSGTDGRSAWADGTTMVERATVLDWFDQSLSAPARKVGLAAGGDYTDKDGNTFTTAFVA